MEQWLQVTGQEPAQFVESMREQSVRAAKLDLALRALAQAESLDANDDDINAEYARIALQVGQKASAIRKAYEAEDAVSELTAQIRKRKALDWLMEHVEAVDEEGHAIDRAVLLELDDHDHDHDHDHSHDHDHDHARHDHDHDHDGHDHHEH